jgi:hypothetical protein
MPHSITNISKSGSTLEPHLAYLRNFPNPERALVQIMESTIPNARAYGATLESFNYLELGAYVESNCTPYAFAPLNLPLLFVAGLAEQAAYNALQRVEQLIHGDALRSNEAYGILRTLFNSAIILPVYNLSEDGKRFCDWVNGESGAGFLNFRDLRLPNIEIERQLLELGNEAVSDRSREYGVAEAFLDVVRALPHRSSFRFRVEWIERFTERSTESEQRVVALRIGEDIALKAQSAIKHGNPVLARAASRSSLIWGTIENEFMREEIARSDKSDKLERARLGVLEEYMDTLDANLTGTIGRDELYWDLWKTLHDKSNVTGLDINELSGKLEELGLKDVRSTFKRYEAGLVRQEEWKIARAICRDLAEMKNGDVGSLHFMSELAGAFGWRTDDWRGPEHSWEPLQVAFEDKQRALRQVAKLIEAAFSHLSSDDRLVFCKVLANGRLSLAPNAYYEALNTSYRLNDEIEQALLNACKDTAREVLRTHVRQQALRNIRRHDHSLTM